MTVGKKMGNGSTDCAQSAQDRFLIQMAKEHRKVDLYLINGTRIAGKIILFDQYVILMKGATTDMVYKHAVSTVQPIAGFRLESDVDANKEASRSPTIIRRTKRRLVKGAGDEG